MVIENGWFEILLCSKCCVLSFLIILVWKVISFVGLSVIFLGWILMVSEFWWLILGVMGKFLLLLKDSCLVWLCVFDNRFIGGVFIKLVINVDVGVL